MCTFYNRVQALCAEKGVSGSRMCLELGLSKSTLSDIKSGRKKGVSTETAQKMAAYFGVSVDYLVTGENKEIPAAQEGNGYSEDELMLLEWFRKGASPMQRKMIGLMMKDSENS